MNRGPAHRAGCDCDQPWFHQPPPQQRAANRQAEEQNRQRRRRYGKAIGNQQRYDRATKPDTTTAPRENHQ